MSIIFRRARQYSLSGCINCLVLEERGRNILIHVDDIYFNSSNYIPDLNQVFEVMVIKKKELDRT